MVGLDKLLLNYMVPRSVRLYEAIEREMLDANGDAMLAPASVSVLYSDDADSTMAGVVGTTDELPPRSPTDNHDTAGHPERDVADGLESSLQPDSLRPLALEQDALTRHPLTLAASPSTAGYESRTSEQEDSKPSSSRKRSHGVSGLSQDTSSPIDEDAPVAKRVKRRSDSGCRATPNEHSSSPVVDPLAAVGQSGSDCDDQSHSHRSETQRLLQDIRIPPPSPDVDVVYISDDDDDDDDDDDFDGRDAVGDDAGNDDNDDDEFDGHDAVGDDAGNSSGVLGEFEASVQLHFDKDDPRFDEKMQRAIADAVDRVRSTYGARVFDHLLVFANLSLLLAHCNDICPSTLRPVYSRHMANTPLSQRPYGLQRQGILDLVPTTHQAVRSIYDSYRNSRSDSNDQQSGVDVVSHAFAGQIEAFIALHEKDRHQVCTKFGYRCRPYTFKRIQRYTKLVAKFISDNMDVALQAALEELVSNSYSQAPSTQQEVFQSGEWSEFEIEDGF